MITDHPSDETLIAFARDALDEEAAVPIADHVAGCADCGRLVERFRLVRRVMETEDPPPDVVARAKVLFAAQAQRAPAPARDALAPLRRIVATLVYDSGGGLAQAGFRGRGDRHLTYIAEAIQVDLRLESPPEDGGAWRVQGQVDADTPVTATAIEMVAAGEDEAIARSVTDEFGMFALTAPAGRYDILLRFPTTLHVLPGVQLG